MFNKYKLTYKNKGYFYKIRTMFSAKTNKREHNQFNIPSYYDDDANVGISHLSDNVSSSHQRKCGRNIGNLFAGVIVGIVCCPCLCYIASEESTRRERERTM
jgi:hypothetical protein